VNILSLLAFTDFILCLLVGLYIINLSAREPLTVSYALLVFSLALWAFCYTFIYSETDTDRLWFWYKLSVPGWVLLQSFGLHFILILTDSPLLGKKWTLPFVYGIAVVLMARAMTGPLLISGFRQGPYGTVEIVAPFGGWTASFVAVFLFVYGWRLTALVLFLARSQRRYLRNQAILFLAVDLTVFVSAFVTNVLIPMRPGNDLPSLGVLFSLVTPVLVWISIRKYKLFYYNLFLKSFSSSQILSRTILTNLFTLGDVFNWLQGSIAIIDRKFRIIDSNEKTADLFERQPDHLMPCHRFYYKRPDPCPGCPMLAGRDGGSHDILYLEAQDRWIEIHTFPLLKGEECDGVMKIGFDVSERIKAERNRADMERVIQHDIRNGLMGIMGTVQVLMGYPSNRSQQEYLELLYRNSLNIKNTINSSLDLYRMETGTYRLEAQDFDLVDLLRRVTKSLSKIAELRGISLRMSVDGIPAAEDSALELKGSPLHIENMFTNLVKNAVEASPAGRTVTISIRTGAGTVIDIHNHGVIPSEIRGRFFQKYVTFNKENGLGLGAYSARIIARAHGGDILFTTDPAAGTHILVMFPGDRPP